MYKSIQAQLARLQWVTCSKDSTMPLNHYIQGGNSLKVKINENHSVAPFIAEKCEVTEVMWAKSYSFFTTPTRVCLLDSSYSTVVLHEQDIKALMLLYSRSTYCLFIWLSAANEIHKLCPIPQMAATGGCIWILNHNSATRQTSIVQMWEYMKEFIWFCFAVFWGHSFWVN